MRCSVSFHRMCVQCIGRQRPCKDLAAREVEAKVRSLRSSADKLRKPRIGHESGLVTWMTEPQQRSTLVELVLLMDRMGAETPPLVSHAAFLHAETQAYFVPAVCGTSESRSHITVTVSSEFSVVSAEFQTQHGASCHVRFKGVTLFHQVCFVRIRVDMDKSRLLLLHDILHEHVLQHDMCHPS